MSEKALTTRQTIDLARQNIADVRSKIKARDKELNRQQKAFASQENNLIFAVDATASRRYFWEQTKTIQSEMFHSAQGAGTKLNAQLVSYSGATHNKDVIASPWHHDAHVLREHMADISCAAGETQIAKVFRHALKECCARPIHVLVLVADSCEEKEHELTPLARQLKEKNIAFFLFDDAARSGERHPDTDSIFKAVTGAANGVYAPFDMKSLDVLEDYLKTVAVVATRNAGAIEYIRREIRTPEGRKMLNQSIQLLGLPTP
ncbi:MAG: hypothetical protein FWF24_01660 [Alphaproteobacteria bacterium]|nr:hypothetical protein [Alphaproteobacteria bacterium]